MYSVFSVLSRDNSIRSVRYSSLAVHHIIRIGLRLAMLLRTTAMYVDQWLDGAPLDRDRCWMGSAALIIMAKTFTATTVKNIIIPSRCVPPSHTASEL